MPQVKVRVYNTDGELKGEMAMTVTEDEKLLLLNVDGTRPGRHSFPAGWPQFYTWTMVILPDDSPGSDRPWFD